MFVKLGDYMSVMAWPHNGT